MVSKNRWRVMLVTAAMALAASGCTSTPVTSGTAKPIDADSYLAPQYGYATPRSFRLTVTRDTGMIGAACPVIIAIDDEEAATIAGGEQAIFFVPAGRHVVGVESTGICAGATIEIEVEATAGEARALRIARGSNGVLSLKPVAP